MNTSIRGDVFRPVDMTGEGLEREYSFPVLTSDGFSKVSVEFERVEANRRMDLERKLNNMARSALKESGSSYRENVGYEIVRDTGPLYHECAFVVVD